MALEQDGIELALKGPDLQADGWLAEKKLFCSVGHLAAFGDGAECAQLLELIALIIKALGFLVQNQPDIKLTRLILNIETFVLSKMSFEN
jgi:hypothetical protein